MTPLAFLVAGEDSAHFSICCTLADRVLVAEVPWLDGLLDTQRTWQGSQERPGMPFPLSKSIERAQARKLRFHGHFGGGPGLPDARMVRALLFLLEDDRSPSGPDAVVIARDMDSDPRREAGIRQAIAAGTWSFPIVVAAADPEIEAWLLCGFEPETQTEQATLESLRSELGFSPHLTPHLLSSSPKSVRETKKIIVRLAANELDRSRKCLEVPLKNLEERGHETGLAAFLGAVREQLVPLFSASAR